jgi:acetyltransferase-like isoleucine patch superfamily enzyme
MNFKKHVIMSLKTPMLQKDSFVEPPVVIQSAFKPNSRIQIGAFTGIYGNNSIIHSCTIGRYCSIADGVVIGPSEHPIDWLSTSMIQYVDNVHNWQSFFEDAELTFNWNKDSFNPKTPPVKIGNDVWIGANAFIKAGVIIGDGAIIAAGSVVVKDIPPYAIAGGSPVRIIKYRFDEKIREKLLSLQWWNYNIFSIEGLKFSEIEIAIATIQLAITNKTIESFISKRIKFSELV